MLVLWVILILVLILADKQKNDLEKENEVVTSAAKYAVACSILTVILTGVVSLAHAFPVARVMLVGTPVEGCLCLTLAAFWAAAVAIVTDTDNNLATRDNGNDSTVKQQNEVVNGNLYYFSWACFVTSMILLVNYIRSVFGIDVVEGFRNRGARLSHWAALIACALVVAGSSGRILDDHCKGTSTSDVEFCRKTKFGISVGAIGVFFSVAVVVMKMVIMSGPMVLEFATSLFLAILNAFGVGYLTASGGPGAPIGNLYYFSWASFLLSAYLTAENLRDMRSVGQESSEHNGNGIHPKHGDDGDIQVEDLDDPNV